MQRQNSQKARGLRRYAVPGAADSYPDNGFVQAPAAPVLPAISQISHAASEPQELS